MFKKLNKRRNEYLLIGRNGNLIVPVKTDTNHRIALILTPNLVPVRLVDAKELVYLESVIKAVGKIRSKYYLEIIMKITPTEGIILVTSSLGVYEMEYTVPCRAENEDKDNELVAEEDPYADCEVEEYFHFWCQNQNYYMIKKL